MSENLPSHPRIPFLDSIRSLMVLSVVVVHSAIAYSNLIPWWPVLDENRSEFFDFFLMSRDIFGIPILYFVAGYFALPALRRKKSVGLFLKYKFKVLGIPFVLFLFFVIPIMIYFLQYARTGSFVISPLEIWIQFLYKAVDLKVGYARPSDLFSHIHLWFVSLLIFFFVLFALACQLKTKLKAEKRESYEIKSAPNTREFILTLLFVGIATALGSILAQQFFLETDWVNIFNILIFQPTKFPIYFGYFLFGIFAYSRNWFIQGDLPGPIIMWLTACIVLSPAFLRILDALAKAGPPSLVMVVIVSMLRSFLCLAFLVLLIKFAFRHWNSASNFNQMFSRNSLYIYLIHMPLVLTLQFFFLNWDISIFIKFTIILAISISLSYAISQYLIRPAPKLSIALLLSGFILFLVFMPPKLPFIRSASSADTQYTVSA